MRSKHHAPCHANLLDAITAMQLKLDEDDPMEPAQGETIITPSGRRLAASVGINLAPAAAAEPEAQAAQQANNNGRQVIGE